MFRVARRGGTRSAGRWPWATSALDEKTTWPSMSGPRAAPFARREQSDVLYGSPRGLASAGRPRSGASSTPGVPGIGEAQGQFGAALAAGRFSASGYDDLAIGVQSQTVGGQRWPVRWSSCADRDSGLPGSARQPTVESRTAQASSAGHSPPTRSVAVWRSSQFGPRSLRGLAISVPTGGCRRPRRSRSGQRLVRVGQGAVRQEQSDVDPEGPWHRRDPPGEWRASAPNLWRPMSAVLLATMGSMTWWSACRRNRSGVSTTRVRCMSSSAQPVGLTSVS